MDARKFGAAALALIAATSAVAGCGRDTGGSSAENVSWSPVTGDDFTANPGAWQTDGVPAPAAGVTMVGNPVAAQAVANAGLPQGTITASTADATVYYPPPPPIPGVPAPAPQPEPAPPMERPANTPPWQYTPEQVAIYRQICDTGVYRDYRAGIEVQSQTCYTLYGRQLGVRPWIPGQPRPWDRPTWPRPWFEADFHADVPLMWVYPPSWTQPRPQPIVSVSIGINIPGNPHVHPNPRYRDDLYVPIWAVTPGRPVEVRGQARVVPPWLPMYTSATVTAATYTPAPTFPGVVLGAMPTNGRAELITALPGARVAGNANTNAGVLVPTAAAVRGATVYNGSRADLIKILGEDPGVRVATRGELDGVGDATVGAGASATRSRTAGATTSGRATDTATSGAGKSDAKTPDRTTSGRAGSDGTTAKRDGTSAKPGSATPSTDKDEPTADQPTAPKTTAPKTTEPKVTIPTEPKITLPTEPKITIPTQPKVTIPETTTKRPTATVEVPTVKPPKITLPTAIPTTTTKPA